MLQQETPQDYVIATGTSRSLEELVDLAFQEVGLNWQQHVKADKTLLRPADIREGLANPDKANRQLGWKATFGLEDVVRGMMQAEQEKYKDG